MKPAAHVLLALAVCSAGATELDARVKWFTTAQNLPASDVLRDAANKATPLDHSADLRLMWRPDVGPLKAVVDHSTIWLLGDSLAAFGDTEASLDQAPSGDDRRLFDLTWELDDGDRHRLFHRFDRFALEYRSRVWGVTVGRQAVSWGSGLVFHPMDLFSPFAPTTVDRDYKAGDDMILVERLFEDGSDLQLLAVGRRSEGDADADASSLAVKYKGFVRQGEVEFVAARHYGGGALGLGLRIPVGGALLRADVMGVEDAGGWTLSGVVNVDTSIPVRGNPVYVFAEYFHNGFGVGRIPDDLHAIPGALDERLGRGETFTLMRNYVATGVQFRWHALVSQSFSLIANVHDSSTLVQMSLAYDPGDASELQAGVIAPLGERGDEFGRLKVEDGLTVGGGLRAYVRFAYYF